MKSGAEEDPFASEEEKDEQNEPDPKGSKIEPDPMEAHESESFEDVSGAMSDRQGDASTNSSVVESEPREQMSSGDTNLLPAASAITGSPGFVLTRSRVKDGREEVMFSLHPETLDAEKSALDQVEDTVGADIYRTDLREAAVLVGLSHTDEIATVLEKWGYEHIQ